VRPIARLGKGGLGSGQPSPGSLRGGITTLEEKSLGCIHQAGHKPIPGMLVAGAQGALFTMGRGAPMGSPLVSVIKITGNGRTFRMMEENIDIAASSILAGDESIDQVWQGIFEEIIKAANGHLPKAESLRHHEFGIHKTAPTY
jgi:altronate dehydratase large subunit